MLTPTWTIRSDLLEMNVMYAHRSTRYIQNSEK